MRCPGSQTTLTPAEADQTVCWLANRLSEDSVPVKIKTCLLMKTMVEKAGPLFQMAIRGLSIGKGSGCLIDNLKAAGSGIGIETDPVHGDRPKLMVQKNARELFNILIVAPPPELQKAAEKQVPPAGLRTSHLGPVGHSDHSSLSN